MTDDLSVCCPSVQRGAAGRMAHVRPCHFLFCSDMFVQIFLGCFYTALGSNSDPTLLDLRFSTVHHLRKRLSTHCILLHARR